MRSNQAPTLPPKFSIFYHQLSQMQMSDAFRDAESDCDSDPDNDDLCCNMDDEDTQQRPFEDCPRPMVRCGIYVGPKLYDLKALVDTGSDFNLVRNSGEEIDGSRTHGQDYRACI